MCIATETVVELFGLADGERWGFLTVKRAASRVVAAALFKFDARLHNVNNIDPAEQVVYKVPGNLAGH